MKALILTTLLLNIFSVCFSQENKILDKYLMDSLDVISGRVEKEVIGARYMEQKLIRTTDTLKGWEGINISLYEYTVNDKTKGDLTTEVYMLNPDSKKLAAWIISGCVLTTNKLEKKSTDFIIKSVKNASGGQFPVLGIVYEDMDGKGFYPYCFKDGVTVHLKDRSVINISAINSENIKGTGEFARIISTTRKQYKKKYGNIDLKDMNWLVVVKKEYKEAMNSTANNLFIAWANDNLK
jgi:hypothetical protein